MENKQWHSLPAAEIEAAFGTDTQGLSNAEVKKRQAQYGLNELRHKEGKTVFEMLVEQMKSVLIWMLILAAVISGIFGEIVDLVAILGIVVLNAVIGVVQEKKAQSSLDALKQMSAPSATVRREGQTISVHSTELVPGDLVVLEAGDLVPADLRLVESINLKVQESALTGESVPVEKDASLILAADAPLGDRINMGFSSATVTYGRGAGIVVETGMNTQVGLIADMLQQDDGRVTPLQAKLNALGKALAVVALAICVLIFAVGVFNGRPLIEMLLTAVSLAVAAIPEGLPAIATIVLALSVQRMVKRNAIVRTLPSVETLGSASVICSDKTGTLTQNRMTVTHLYADQQLHPVADAPEGDVWRQLLLDCVLCNDARYGINEGAVTAVGDPTEIALIDLGKNLGMEKVEAEEAYPRVAELPFDSERKLMTTVHRMDGFYRVFVKGGVDMLLPRCTHIYQGGETKPFGEADLQAVSAANDTMANDALRVLAMAYKDLTELVEKDQMDTLETDLTFIGLTGMIDPPRLEAREAVAVCRKAGIRTVMITGDHLATALAIAKSLDIYREGDMALNGIQVESMSDQELAEQVEHISVYARISPEHKVRIVNAWRQHGHIVAMTGDGVNDAPALKNADIGAAMGIVGTEVAKEAADIILTDDNFATVVSAVEEGRRIYDNILKAIQFLLSSNVGEIIVLFIATMFNWEEPLLPVHILWVNLVTDSLPALGLGMDQAERGIMERPVRHGGSLFSRGIIWRICYQGGMIGMLTLLAFRIGLHTSIEVARTMAFCVLAFSQLVHSNNVRSIHSSVFSKALPNSKYLWFANIASVALMLLVLLVPFMEDAFGLVDLTMSHWLLVGLLSFVPLVFVELMKLLKLNDLKEK